MAPPTGAASRDSVRFVEGPASVGPRGPGDQPVSNSCTTGTLYDTVGSQYDGGGAHKNMGTLGEIETFDSEKVGTGSVQDFLESSENAAALGNLDASDLMRVYPSVWRAGPETSSEPFWRPRVCLSRPPMWDSFGPEFKADISEQFRKQADPLTDSLQLRVCRQGDTEGVRAYAMRIKALAYKA